jgi:8-oxo-dGTP diphosphatase
MIRVALAIIIDREKQVLITKRPFHVSHGGFWEFPGGKIESNELPEQALIREVKEEVGLEVLKYQYIGHLNHEYSDKSVRLYIFLVTHFSGIPLCVEGQLAIEWKKQSELNPEDFPEANGKVIALVHTVSLGCAEASLKW